MDFVFLVGIEGSGHHMTRDILEDYLQDDRVVDVGGWHWIMSALNDPTRKVLQADAPKPIIRTIKFFEESGNPMPDLGVRWAQGSPAERETIAREIMKNVFEVYAKEGKTHLFDSSSFPYQNPRNAMRRPDVYWLRQMTQEVGLRSRWLVLDRDPKSLAWSAFRRGFTDDLHEQARIVEDNLIYIASQLKMIDRDEFRIMRFEEFLADPGSFSQVLADWIGTTKEVIESRFSSLRTPTQRKDIPEDSTAFLERFFTEERAAAWVDVFEDPTQRLLPGK